MLRQHSLQPGTASLLAAPMARPGLSLGCHPGREPRTSRAQGGRRSPRNPASSMVSLPVFAGVGALVTVGVGVGSVWRAYEGAAPHVGRIRPVRDVQSIGGRAVAGEGERD